MATVDAPTSPAAIATLADLLERLGGIDPARIRFRPPPGTATEADLLRLQDRDDLLCELVDGVLVQKPPGFAESALAVALGSRLHAFVRPRNLGLLSGADACFRLATGLVRSPDVAFVSWGRIPGGRVPKEPIPGLAPDLAIEVLSPDNTKAEMIGKRREYFAAGVRLVWEVDPKARTVAVDRGLEAPIVLDRDALLDGGDVLPGFALPLADLFAELDRKGPGAV